MVGLFRRAENTVYALVMTEHTQYRAIDIFQQKMGNRFSYVVLKTKPTVVLRVWFWSFGIVAEEPAQVCRQSLLAGWIVHFLILSPSFAGCSSSGHLLPYWNKKEHTECFRAPGWNRCGLFLFIRMCLNFTRLGFLFNLYVCVSEREREPWKAVGRLMDRCAFLHTHKRSHRLCQRGCSCLDPCRIFFFFLLHSECCSFTAISIHCTAVYSANQELLISLVISMQLHLDESRGCWCRLLATVWMQVCAYCVFVFIDLVPFMDEKPHILNWLWGVLCAGFVFKPRYFSISS